MSSSSALSLFNAECFFFELPVQFHSQKSINIYLLFINIFFFNILKLPSTEVEISNFLLCILESTRT